MRGPHHGPVTKMSDWETRFELVSIEDRDDVLYITVAVFRKIPGSEEYVKGNVRTTETIASNHWRFVNGQLITMNEHLQWEVFTGSSAEADFVRREVERHKNLPIG